MYLVVGLAAMWESRYDTPNIPVRPRKGCGFGGGGFVVVLVVEVVVGLVDLVVGR